MEKRERVRRNRRRENEQKDDGRLENNWRENERRDSDRRDDNHRDSDRRDDNRRDNDRRDDNRRDSDRRDDNRRDSDRRDDNRRDGNRRDSNFRQDDGPRKQGRDNNRNNRPKSYRPPPPAEKKDIDYTAIPDPHMFDNLKRETDEIAALTTKKYSKRQVFSNWAKYEKPIDPPHYEVEEDERRGADFEVLLQGAQIGGHMKLKSESSWDNRCAALQHEIFSLNLGNLSLGLACIPFYEKMDLPQDMFMSADVERMDSQAKLSTAAYEVAKKNNIKPRIKRQEPTKSASESELSLFNSSDTVQTKANPSAALTFDIPEPEPEDKIDFGIPPSSGKDNLKKPFMRSSPEKAFVRSHQTPPPENRSSPLRTYENKKTEMLENISSEDDRTPQVVEKSYENMNGFQSPERNKTTSSNDRGRGKVSKDEMLLEKEREACYEERYVTNDKPLLNANEMRSKVKPVPDVENIRPETVERISDIRRSVEKDVPESRWSSEREESSQRWSVEKEESNDRWSVEREATFERRSIEKEEANNRWNIDREVTVDRRSVEKEKANDRWSAEREGTVDRSVEKEKDKNRWSATRELPAERNSPKEEVVDNRWSAEREITGKNQNVEKDVEDKRWSAEREVTERIQNTEEDITVLPGSEAYKLTVEMSDKEGTVKKRKTNRNRGNKGNKKKSADIQGEDYRANTNEEQHESKPTANSESEIQERAIPQNRNKLNSESEGKPARNEREGKSLEYEVPAANVQKNYMAEPERPDRKLKQHYTPEPEVQKAVAPEPVRNLVRQKSATPETEKQPPRNVQNRDEQRNRKERKENPELAVQETKEKFAGQESIRDKKIETESVSVRAPSIEKEVVKADAFDSPRKPRKRNTPEAQPVATKQKSPEVDAVKNKKGEVGAIKNPVNMSGTISIGKGSALRNSTEKSAPAKPPEKPSAPKKPGQEDDQLDFLLSLRKPSSGDTSVSFAKPSKAVRSTIDDDDEKPKLPSVIQEKSSEDLEDWLDSMLDD
ncbi:myb-like protein X [Anabrus simplex]|uniref:myb-like protein X n=1 Tax=Anabrus simplex TaxID=316456 RepID=UPI0035A392E9